MKTAFGSPFASRVTSPVRPSVEEEKYTPGVRVCPAMSGRLVASGARPAASLYAVVRSVCACPATASVAWTEPCNVMEERPVIAVPGLTPRSPVIVVGPVLVTVLAPSTPKLSAVPRPTRAWLEAMAGSSRMVETKTSETAADPKPVDKSLRHLIAHLPGGFWSRGWGSPMCSGWPCEAWPVLGTSIWNREEGQATPGPRFVDDSRQFPGAKSTQF